MTNPIENFKDNLVLLQKFKDDATAFDNAGTLYTDNIYGQHIYEVIEQKNIAFLNDKIKSDELNHYILFYCFLATYLFQQYKYFSAEKPLLDYAAYEITYNVLYDFIDIDIYNFSLTEV